VPRTAAEFRAHPFLVYDEDLAMLAPWWRASFGRSEPLPAKFVFRVTSLYDLRHLPQEGAGLTVLPDYFVARDCRGGTLERLLPKGGAGQAAAAKNPISLCWRREGVDTARLRVVRARLLAGR
jgi:DNA-binding transcriptional LysR family regulator